MTNDALLVLQQTCRAVLALRDEGSIMSLAERVVARYQSLDPTGHEPFFSFLLDGFSPDPDHVAEAIQAYQRNPSPATAQTLSTRAEAPRQELFRRINTAPGGTHVMLQMRADCLALGQPELHPVAFDLEHLLRAWFNRGFLQLERIDASTPTAILEKLIAYEAVHEIRSWDDLHRRLAPDRRCFGFFHPTLPDEPLIFVEVALVHGLQGSIHSVLDAPIPHDAEAALVGVDTAIFYSITNCQAGLRGVPLGSFLLKQVTVELRRQLPQLCRFATLSPIPGFADWLGSGNVPAPDDFESADKARLLGACARYLVSTRADGFPLDPVARFHLRNGARLERLNWAGDTSPKGMAQSLGMLVNYVYDPEQLVDNHEAYINEQRIARSATIDALLATG